MNVETVVFHIEDDSDESLVFSSAMESFENVRFFGFTTFDQALKSAALLQPDVIFMDFWVPGMTISQFLGKLSSIVGTSAIRLVIVSGTEVPFFFRELLEKYKVDYQLKKNSVKEIEAMVSRYLAVDLP